ncbi:nuclear transport factor 2 family protein [Fodinibius saliphilus]|uniref:nuclear transport factor 2 family protein n=1 Tax=Fodinibius saliphilus TaxID=1920650 RepID=UPI001107B664|nr:nuclear transport factor 2 family protein [Fodinibius saliphilus]
MKRSLIGTIILLFIVSVSYGQMKEVKEAIKAKEKAIYEAIKNGDIEVFKKSTADDMMSVYNSGYTSRMDEIERLSGMQMDSYKLSDFKFMHPADNVVVVIYTAEASGMNAEGTEFDGKYYSTSTWVNADNDWKAILHTQVEAMPMTKQTTMESDYEKE